MNEQPHLSEIKSGLPPGSSQAPASQLEAVLGRFLEDVRGLHSFTRVCTYTSALSIIAAFWVPGGERWPFVTLAAIALTLALIFELTKLRR